MGHYPQTSLFVQFLISLISFALCLVGLLTTEWRVVNFSSRTNHSTMGSMRYSFIRGQTCDFESNRIIPWQSVLESDCQGSSYRFSDWIAAALSMLSLSQLASTFAMLFSVTILCRKVAITQQNAVFGMLLASTTVGFLCCLIGVLLIAVDYRQRRFPADDVLDLLDLRIEHHLGYSFYLCAAACFLNLFAILTSLYSVISFCMALLEVAPYSNQQQTSPPPTTQVDQCRFNAAAADQTVSNGTDNLKTVVNPDKLAPISGSVVQYNYSSSAIQQPLFFWYSRHFGGLLHLFRPSLFKVRHVSIFADSD